MNSNIRSLYLIAKKKKRQVIGLMSGTSLDGLDVALCEIECYGADTKLTTRHFATKKYDEGFKKEIRKIFSKKNVDLQLLCLLNEWVAEQHAAIVNECLAEWKVKKENVDLIASHGQTIYHAPRQLHKNKKFGDGTLQIGDGDHIAVRTGIITISDFRQKHIAAGGQGAPLAAYGDYLLFKEKNADVILLNIGGIANFTYLPKDGKIFSTDIGPGNTMMDAWMQKKFPGSSFDNNSSVAKAGKVNQALLKSLKTDPFLKLPFPKTTGPELFNLSYLEKAIKESHTEKVSVYDTMATLNKFTADIVCKAINSLTKKEKQTKIYTSGGGMHNPLLNEYLNKNIRNASIDSTALKNIDPDAKEAILFAILANECVAGNGDAFEPGINNFPEICMGKISMPS